LQKDLTRDIKRGHMWLYGDAIDRPRARAGSVAIVIDRRGDKIASGIYDPDHAIPLRIARTSPPWDLGETWLAQRCSQALAVRRAALGPETTGFRLFNGEGDGLPGLVVDLYSDVAVMKLDGGAPQVFYDRQWLATWLQEFAGARTVVYRPRQRGEPAQIQLGQLASPVVNFLENGLHFTADVLHGQKTGFFLDQRDNRGLVRQLARDRTVLNLFSFSGGFSIAAGAGGAARVTSVDLAPAAIAASQTHWQTAGLPSVTHSGVVSDAFQFLEQAIASKQQWDLVICDPPSFAPSERTKAAAGDAYQRLAQMSARVTTSGGMLALASCSSHISPSLFRELNLAGIGRARRAARLLVERSLPVDHPTPLAMPELAYLKFQLLQLD
jgi:23S rRNA (cytosine1962-C5)-methyltransferase